ncbi:MAG: orotate phosphoribosyltransferase [Spirochaetota bacterium]|nr:orotate phosphoribosyltransferase [Spirochaetota bacterium]
MDISNARERLFNLLYSRSFLYREDPPFKLANGGVSPYYFNCKTITLDPEGCFLSGKLVFQAIKGFNIDAIGGLTLGADPISLSTILEAFQNSIRISPLIVRKEPKKHGTSRWIEGNLEGVQRAVVVDDVITTGQSTITAIDRLRDLGIEIASVVVLIDREEGGRENIEATGVEVISLFNRTDFDLKMSDLAST